MINQLIWLASLPVVIFISYKVITLAYKHLEKKQLL